MKASLSFSERLLSQSTLHLFLPILLVLSLASSLYGQADSKKPTAADTKKANQESVTDDFAKTKQEEARKKLQIFEEAMNRLERRIRQTDPEKAAKLKAAFKTSRERLIREGMEKILTLIKQDKFHEAIEDQKVLKSRLEEILQILLERDIDLRELIKEIKKLRDVVQGLDQVIKEETEEKIASDNADAAGKELKQAADANKKIKELTEAQKEIENELKKNEGKTGPNAKALEKKELNELAKKQADLQKELEELIQQLNSSKKSSNQKDSQSSNSKGQNSKGADPSKSNSDSQNSKSPSKSGKSGKSGKQGQSSQSSKSSSQSSSSSSSSKSQSSSSSGSPKQQKLNQASKKMSQASKSMQQGQKPQASQLATEARKALEAAQKKTKEQLERLRRQRDFKKMKKDQDSTKAKTLDLAKKMERTPPLTHSPKGGVPGKEDVQKASQSMGQASESLSSGEASQASPKQQQALNQLKKGRDEAERTLENLQKALRERLLAYLKERITFMLDKQKRISKNTRSLNLAIKVANTSEEGSLNKELTVSRRNQQKAQNLARQESALALVADDIIDILTEDGTTLVFPQLVGAVKNDLQNVAQRLLQVKTQEHTQQIQRDIEASLRDILEAIKQTQKKPAPPNPGKGRQSKSGTGPLLPKSTELKMVLALQKRVNERTKRLDNNLKVDLKNAPQEHIEQSKRLSEQQEAVRKLLLKIARSMR